MNWMPLVAALKTLVETGAIAKRQNSSRDEYYITVRGKEALRHVDIGISMLLPDGCSQSS